MDCVAPPSKGGDAIHQCPLDAVALCILLTCALLMTSSHSEGFGTIWSIMDRVQVPSNLPPGDYVLGWRWDTEELPQVWTNCADVQLR